MKTTVQTHSPLRHSAAQAAWWRFPIMWLVVAGPAVVVLAGVVTAWLAIDGADPSVVNVPRARDVAQGGVKVRSDAPAQQVRNLAGTPVGGSVERPVAPAVPTSDGEAAARTP